MGLVDAGSSGLYPVVDVAGRRPTLLTDFIGAATITVIVEGEARPLVGVGGLTANGMEFEQRYRGDADGEQVRVWTITEDLDAAFWAEPLPVR